MNKYQQNYLMWLFNIPRELAKAIIPNSIKITHDGKFKFKFRAEVNTKDWRGCYGTTGE